MKKVLLVDPDARDGFLKELLEWAGIKVFFAKNEEEFIRHLRLNTIDIIILEPLLSIDFLINESSVENIEIGGTGFRLLEKMKRYMRYRVKIILYTVVSHQDITKAGFLEMNSYLRKPMPSAVLIEEINRL